MYVCVYIYCNISIICICIYVYIYNYIYMYNYIYISCNQYAWEISPVTLLISLLDIMRVWQHSNSLQCNLLATSVGILCKQIPDLCLTTLISQGNLSDLHRFAQKQPKSVVRRTNPSPFQYGSEFSTQKKSRCFNQNQSPQSFCCFAVPQKPSSPAGLCFGLFDETTPGRSSP